jgi:carbonic anhydrase/acetyltransferase-like protein (isoleucine patch superfamily)
MAIFEYKGMRPVIGSETYIADSAEVIGQVLIGSGVYVGPGAKIRGDYGEIRIGDGTAVEENCVLHARPEEICTVGSRVTLGHMCIVHNARLIDDDAVIGMGAIISDWAAVGAWAVVAEGALVKNRQEIPSGKIAAGIPARVIGDVSEQYRADWTRFKQLYIDLARNYRRDLRRLD